MYYHHEGPGDQREGVQGWALHVREGDHKNVKNKRKLTKLGKKFLWVKNIKDQPRTTIMEAQGNSERGNKVELFM